MKLKISLEAVAEKICLIRGQKVMLGKDLADLYGVETRMLIQAVNRNRDRFPPDFCFRLTWEEAKNLRSQFVILKHGEHIKYRPYAFTEQGVAMLSSVLRSEKAVQVNVAIMRAFVRLREYLSAHKELALQLADHERKIGKHEEQIQSMVETLRQLLSVPEKPKRRIGFIVEEDRRRTNQRRRSSFQHG